MQSALIAGAGASGFLHALALRSAGVRIAAVFDPDRASARNLVELVGGEPCTSLDRALRHDAAIAAVCSPPIHHVAQAAALADGRRLVFVEKPVALSNEELERLRTLPRVVPIVQWRSGRSASELRAAIEAGVFGARPRIHCELRLWRDAAYFARRDAARWGCGAMLSIGIHALDLVLWIANRRVVASRGREGFGRPTIDVATAGEIALELEGGASARVAITLDEPRACDVRLAVEGDGTTAYLHAAEADPTGTPLSWRGPRAVRYPAPAGALGSPLLVPFIHEALAAPRPLAIDDVAAAHRLVFALTSRSAPTDLCRRPA
ncbi:MAG: Gfo/Idh/MocA family oxidoreductase [Labilithrix sp.]|nr:Gfo/Idh/MocA family oxidoreductase [Labilithrix sp.]MCW5813163.1 Gfo/Idh/MocA family oxidoreductase [Labilithrix sp.]